MTYSVLEKRLNYRFNDLSLLGSALTHRSVRGSNNERLEFLGDSIVNCVISMVLYEKYPSAKEGELSRLRAALVKGETLASVAQEFDLGQFIRLGAGESKSGGANRQSILADAMEAIIGAVYLDSGFGDIQSLILDWYSSRINSTSLKESMKDPKTQLQEYLQARKLSLPTYTVVETSGIAHAQTFYVECKVIGISCVTQGEGSSRRKAEQIAAKRFLVALEKK